MRCFRPGSSSLPDFARTPVGRASTDTESETEVAKVPSPSSVRARAYAVAALTLGILSLISSIADAQDVVVETVTDGDDVPAARVLGVRRPNGHPPNGHPPTVVVEVPPSPVVVPGPVIVEVVDPDRPPHSHIHVTVTEEVEEPRLLGWSGLWGFVESADLVGLDFELDDPEVAILDGLRLGSEHQALDNATIGGVSIGTAFEATEWLRVPEIRISLGGAALNGAFRPVGEIDGVAVRPESLFFLRAELGAGLYHRVGPFVPYLHGRIGVGGYFLDVEVRDRGLGAIGSETAIAGAFEAGFEAGLDVAVGRHFRARAAYRNTALGVPSHGVIFGFTAGFGDE
ncbi:MAG: hypothetical protein AAGF12_20935 [Myxococcota bacterium]